MKKASYDIEKIRKWVASDEYRQFMRNLGERIKAKEREMKLSQSMTGRIRR